MRPAYHESDALTTTPPSQLYCHMSSIDIIMSFGASQRSNSLVTAIASLQSEVGDGDKSLK